jgi:hypothetical protein
LGFGFWTGFRSLELLGSGLNFSTLKDLGVDFGS